MSIARPAANANSSPEVAANDDNFSSTGTAHVPKGHANRAIGNARLPSGPNHLIPTAMLGGAAVLLLPFALVADIGRAAGRRIAARRGLRNTSCGEADRALELSGPVERR